MRVSASEFDNDEGDLDILAFLVHDHHLRDEVLDVGRDGLLADSLDEFAEFERQPLFALYSAVGLTPYFSAIESRHTFFLPMNELQSMLTP